jgi:hypothetical protein
MTYPTLHSYLKRYIGDGIIDFAIRAELQPGDTVKFYIHPAHASGETSDFLLWEHPKNDIDLLINELECPRTSADKLLKMIRERHQTPNKKLTHPADGEGGAQQQESK